MTGNPVDSLRSGWNKALPELDVGPMLTVARLNRAAILVRRQLSRELARHESSLADFDVLSTLRRQAPPHSLTPSELSDALLLSPSGMTNRIDQLERSGLVERSLDPDNRRSMPVALTSLGVSKAEELAEVVIETERLFLAGLNSTDIRKLDELMDSLLEGVEAES